PPQPSPRSCLEGRGSSERGESVAVSRCGPVRRPPEIGFSPRLIVTLRADLDFNVTGKDQRFCQGTECCRCDSHGSGKGTDDPPLKHASCSWCSHAPGLAPQLRSLPRSPRQRL